MGLFNGEGSCLLSRRKLLERCHKLSHQWLRGKDKEIVVKEPIVVRVASDIGPFVWIGPQIE